MIFKWLAKRKEQAARCRFETGFNYAVGALLRGEETEEQLRVRADSFFADEFDDGILAGLKALNNRDETIRTTCKVTEAFNKAIQEANNNLYDRINLRALVAKATDTPKAVMPQRTKMATALDSVDSLTNWDMKAARGECAWICSDCCQSFPSGMPDECCHGVKDCTDIIQRDKQLAKVEK